MKFIKRLSTHPKLTVGKIYRLQGNSRLIIDDTGNNYTVFLPPRGGSNVCWEDVTESTPCKMFHNMEFTHPLTHPPLEETTMPLTLKKTTLINCRDCDMFSLDDLLEMIDEEQKRIDRLQTTLAGSKAIAKLTKKHKDNITALIKIVDARPVE